MIFNNGGKYGGDDFTGNKTIREENFNSFLKENNRKVELVLEALNIKGHTEELKEYYREQYLRLLEASLDVLCLQSIQGLQGFCVENDLSITFDESERYIDKISSIQNKYIVKNKKCAIAHTVDRPDRVIVIQSKIRQSIGVILSGFGDIIRDKVAQAGRPGHIPVFI